ncbi:MAG: DNA/RNA non-specific endonuclease [Bacteroidia bacterium]|nr:DNA/RNA non-specific endonuclease [Bacteroidia bacterium]
MFQSRSKFENYITLFIVTLVVALFVTINQRREGKISKGKSDSKIAEQEATPPTQDDHLTLGNPSNANANDSENLLLRKPQYALSYNCLLNRANWVAWHLSRAWLGEVDRQNNFRADESLPRSCSKVNMYDYTGSGFDRGHLCPSGDRTRNPRDNSATFLMTNIVPQAPLLNRGVWEKLESYCRLLALEGNELYIIAGVYGEGGEGSERSNCKKKVNESTTETSGDSKRKKLCREIGKDVKISVPARFFKIILILPNGENDLQRISEATEVIATDFPNYQLPEEEPWEKYQVSIEQIEKATGWKFFTALPPKLQIVLKEKTKRKARLLPPI